MKEVLHKTVNHYMCKYGRQFQVLHVNLYVLCMGLETD
jgi:hypothetical protein